MLVSGLMFDIVSQGMTTNPSDGVKPAAGTTTVGTWGESLTEVVMGMTEPFKLAEVPEVDDRVTLKKRVDMELISCQSKERDMVVTV